MNSYVMLRIIEENKLLHDAEDIVLLDVREFVLLSLCVEKEYNLCCGAVDHMGMNSSAILMI